MIVITAIIVLAAVLLYLNLRSGALRRKVRDPRRFLTPNATNYNISDVLPEEVIEQASAAEAEEIIRKVRSGELPSLTEKDFHRLQRKVARK